MCRAVERARACVRVPAATGREIYIYIYILQVSGKEMKRRRTAAENIRVYKPLSCVIYLLNKRSERQENLN